MGQLKRWDLEGGERLIGQDDEIECQVCHFLGSEVRFKLDYPEVADTRHCRETAAQRVSRPLRGRWVVG